MFVYLTPEPGDDSLEQLRLQPIRFRTAPGGSGQIWLRKSTFIFEPAKLYPNCCVLLCVQSSVRTSWDSNWVALCLTTPSPPAPAMTQPMWGPGMPGSVEPKRWGRRELKWTYYCNKSSGSKILRWHRYARHTVLYTVYSKKCLSH